MQNSNFLNIIQSIITQDVVLLLSVLLVVVGLINQRLFAVGEA